MKGTRQVIRRVLFQEAQDFLRNPREGEQDYRKLPRKVRRNIARYLTKKVWGLRGAS